MTTQMSSHSLTDLVTTLWASNSLQLNRSARPRPSEPERKRRKVIAALKNRGFNLHKAGDTISEDETEFERQYGEIRGFGYSWMVPTGRITSQEDEADAFLDPAEHDEASPGPRPTMTHPLLGAAARPRDDEAPADNQGEQDLDADIEDADAPVQQSNTSEGVSAGSSSSEEGGREHNDDEEGDQDGGESTDSP